MITQKFVPPDKHHKKLGRKIFSSSFLQKQIQTEINLYGIEKPGRRHWLAHLRYHPGARIVSGKHI